MKFSYDGGLFLTGKDSLFESIYIYLQGDLETILLNCGITTECICS